MNALTRGSGHCPRCPPSPQCFLPFGHLWASKFSGWTWASTPALCEVRVRTRCDLILPETSLVLEIAWGARELWKTKIQFLPLPSHLNLRRCKFHVSRWWQIRAGPDLTTQLLLEGLRGGLIRLSLHPRWPNLASWRKHPMPAFSGRQACGGIESSLHWALKALMVWWKTLCRLFFHHLCAQVTP